MSELLHRLRTELGSLTDPAARAEVIARVAAVHARSGDFDEAKRAINAIKENFGRGESGRVTVWKMIAEGLVFHYENLSPSALERICGALVLGRAMQYSAVTALASAWKAHIEFERSDFAKMAESLKEALQNVGPSDHDAQTRIAMVFANAYMICGDRASMHKWFMRGREHAVKNGDRASIEALQYNRAAFATAWARVSACSSPIGADEIALLRGEVNSSQNLFALVRTGALSAHIRLVHARLLILENRYDLAILALTEVRVTEPFAGHNFHQLYVDLEVEFCKVQLGQNEAPLVDKSELLLHQFKVLDLDEQVVAVWMLERNAEKCGMRDKLVLLQSKLRELKAELEDQHKFIKGHLESVASACPTIPTLTFPS